MAIAGLKKLPTTAYRVSEAVDTSVQMLYRLDLVEDEAALRTSLTSDFGQLAKLGEGRLYVQLSAAVPTAKLLALASELAVARGFDSPFRWKPLWVPGTEAESLSESEQNGTVASITARLALYSDNQYDRLLHFGRLSYDDKYREKGKATQLEELERVTRNFTSYHAGTTLEAADDRDFLVWYIMDLLRKLPANELVLASGVMRVVRYGRRRVDGGSFVGRVDSDDGQAFFDGSYGGARPGAGVGLSVGLQEG